MAAGRELTASFRLRLLDGLSAGLSAIQRRFERLGAVARRLGALAAIGGALSFAGPVQQAAAFEDILRQNAITAARTGAEVEAMIARTGGAYERLAVTTGQRSRAIADAAAILFAANVPDELIEQFMPILSRVATATGAQLNDLAALAVSLQQNLRIGPQEMTRALASMVQAGKEGRFELRDMAREFPQLTAAVDALGLRGMEAVTSLSAMLQVARRGAATSSEAANNLANFLQKISSPETVRHFREAGVNLEALLTDAARRGINPIEAVVQEIRRISQGNMFRVGELFGDRQVLDFLRPILRQEGVAEYLRVLQAAREANESLIDQDFESRRRGMFINLEIATERIEQLGRRLSGAIGSNLGMVNSALAAVQQGVEWLDQHYPGQIDLALSWAGAIVVGAGALGLMVPVLGVVATGLGLLFSPGGLIFAAIAGAVLLWRNWERIGPLFRGLWDRVVGHFQGWVAWLRGWVSGAVANAVWLIRGTWWVLTTWFSTLWGVVRSIITAFSDWVDGWTGGAMTAAIQAIIRAWEAVREFFRQLWDDVVAAFSAVWDRIRPVIERVERAVQSLQGSGQGELSNPEGQARRRQNFRDRGRAGGFYAPEDAAPAGAGGGRAAVGGEIVVRAAPGTEVVETRSTNPAVPITVDRGRTLGRP